MTSASTPSSENSSITIFNNNYIQNTKATIREGTAEIPLTKAMDTPFTRLSTPPEDLEVSEEVEGSGSGEGAYEPQIEASTTVTPTTTMTTSTLEEITTITENLWMTHQSNEKVIYMNFSKKSRNLKKRRHIFNLIVSC
ncbi:uncharacterized protein [Drosophila suzukii]|uniref:Uncharacterized protein isoform X2 n=1 Tax=Drosophila suzukii TaxID=28584 RepID=A0ABM4TKM2_DROSZ